MAQRVASGMMTGMSRAFGRSASLLGGLAACGVQVDLGAYDGSTTVVMTTTDEPPGSSSSDATVASSSSGDTNLPGMQDDMAILVGDLPSSGGSDTGANTSVGSGGESGDLDALDAPDTLEIQSGNFPQSCADPYGGLPTCGGWSVGFRLPLAEQFVGATGALSDHRGGVVETSPGSGDCGFGGGSLIGNFEITAIDDTSVAGRLTDLELFSAGTEIEFVAPRCP